MHEIVPNLYLSCFHSVQISNPSTFVVNCTKNLNILSKNNLRIAVDDDCSKECIDDMIKALPGAVENIHYHLQMGIPVIVHCLAGQQRSPTVVAAYLVSKRGFSLEDAVRHIRKIKKDAFFYKINFEDALVCYCSSLNLQEASKEPTSS